MAAKAGVLTPEPERTIARARSWSLLTCLGALYLAATPLDFVPTPVGTPVTITAVLFLAQWVVARLIGSQPRAPRSAMTPVIGALAVWSFVTSIWSVDPGVSIGQSFTVGLLGVSTVAVASTFQQDIRTPAHALMLGSSVAAVAALVSDPTPVGPYGVISQQATFLDIDPNALSFHLCLGLAASYYLVLTQPRVERRIVPILLALLMVVAILAVGSRTGGGALVVTTLTLAVLSAKSPRTAVVGTALVAAMAWIVYRMAQAGSLPERLSEWYRAPVLVDSRSTIIEQFWTFRDEWMFQGVGAGADAEFLRGALGVYTNAHSAFWKTWIELGVVGVILWSALMWIVCYRFFNSRARLLLVLCAPTVAAFFYTLGPLNSNVLWALFGLALGARVRPVKEGGTPAPPSAIGDRRTRGKSALDRS